MSICYFWCYGTPVVAGGSTNRASGNGRYASVTEQSGIQAGDGGFDVKVAGNTDLTGGVIASTDAAVDGGKNRFETGSLTTSDIVNVDTFGAKGYSVAAGYNSTSSVGVGKAASANTSVTASGISGFAGNAQVRTGDGSNGLTPSWVASELLADVNAQVRITSTATGILVQMTPKIVEALTQLVTAGGTAGAIAPTQIDRANQEFGRLLSEPGLTDEQRGELKGLKNFFDALVAYGQSQLGSAGGPDSVVGGSGTETTPTQFLIPGMAGGGVAAGGGIAGQGANGQDQGYRDPESGQWIGGSPPLQLPSLSSLEQLVLTNPVLGPVYRAYVAMAQEMPNATLAADPTIPAGLLGTRDAQSGARGNRINNGPLDPANGGTGNAREDFDYLTGGHSHPAPEGSSFPPGTRIGDNGIIFRPESAGSGPRIDVPSNGSKPHETLHYPS